MPVHSSNRRGSALLIVLGFLSFMVVSAVAFAVFMRAERAPSSALRRGVATRHLVKAALARAISTVDDAIRDDIFPGRAGSGRSGQPYRDRLNNDMDVWYGRVFMPPDPEGGTINGQAETRFAPISETVSVLNLEGLGYLPPSLINDVRFLSRCSWSSKWQNLPYDSGRCAYVAVNVSDYFDINRLSANQGRSSADDRMISLATVFMDAQGTKVDTTAAKAFDSFVHEQRVTDSDATATMPYTSLLDYNLALGDQYRDQGFGGGYNSPFWTWVNNARNGMMYQTLATNGSANAEYASRQTFVTDTWFPRARVSSGGVDPKTNLFYEVAQPFRNGVIQKGVDQDAATVLNSTDDFKDIMQKRRNYLNLTDWITLYDYLDEDDVPLTLVQPCVERVPMTAALQPEFGGFQMQCNVSQVVNKPPQGVPGNQETITTAKLMPNHIQKHLALKALFAFPFKRGKELNKGQTFKAQAMIRVVLVASQAPFDSTGFPLRGANLYSYLRPKRAEWTGGTRPYELARAAGQKVGVLTYVSREKTLSFPSEITEEEHAFMDGGQTTFTDLTLNGNPEEIQLFQRVESQPVTATGTAQGEKTVTWQFANGARPLTIGGELLPDGQGDDYANWTIRPVAAVWVKITNNDGDVVDYVPAVLNDDVELGGVNNRVLASVGAARVNHGPQDDNGGEQVMAPMLPLVGMNGLQIQTALQTAGTAGPAGQDVPPVQIEFQPKSYYTVDPRYNWAPEDWLPKSKTVSRNDWLDSLNGVLGVDGHDLDIFMGYSNQGYLQSMGEISMLPRQTDANGSTVSVFNNFNGAPRKIDGDWTEVAHSAVVWKTYPADYEVDDNLDKLFANEELGQEGTAISSEGSGFRVNPYTDNIRIMRAVIQSTPCDWWAAGTNYMGRGQGANKTHAALKRKMMEDAGEAVKYAYGEDNPEAKLHQDDVNWIASYLMQQFAANPRMNWEEVYDRLDWRGDGDPAKLFGHELKNNVTLHGVDRKFLHAFWRGCFANKQQLFLIFVRAESNALGGPGEGTPAQQGGRAVALVWRDPVQKSYETDNRDQQPNYEPVRRPHRTRILFYHQFD